MLDVNCISTKLEGEKDDLLRALTGPSPEKTHVSLCLPAFSQTLNAMMHRELPEPPGIVAAPPIPHLPSIMALAAVKFQGSRSP